jgi:hypothetical protein
MDQRRLPQSKHIQIATVRKRRLQIKREGGQRLSANENPGMQMRAVKIGGL